MLFDDTYLTIQKPAEAIFRDRGSRFLCFVYPITTEGEAKQVVAKLKTEHPKANHYCWALRLSPDWSIFRANDDGEPVGTAGKPILNVLLSKNLTNILVVVVRYFGGTLLGVPGLINAYKSVTELAIKGAVIIERTVKDVYTIKFGYLKMNEVMKIIKDNELMILEQRFDNDCAVTIAIRKTEVNRVVKKMENVSGLIIGFDYTI